MIALKNTARAAIFLLACLVCLCSLSAARAQDGEQSSFSEPPTTIETLRAQIEPCTKFESYILRLQCFDSLAVDIGFEPPSQTMNAQKELGKFGKWDIVEKRSNVGELVVDAALPANVSYITKGGIERTAELVLSCKANHTNAFINWKGPVAPNNDFKVIEVVYLFDSDTGVKANWDVSLDRYALFIPRPIGFIQSMHGKKILTVQLTPQMEELTTLVFTLNGVEDVLKVMAKQCYN